MMVDKSMLLFVLFPPPARLAGGYLFVFACKPIVDMLSDAAPTVLFLYRRELLISYSLLKL